MIEVVFTNEFGEWFEGLDQHHVEPVAEAVDLLANLGLRLGTPHSSQIKGASFGLRELRIQSDNRPLRVFYAFDPRRDAVLLIGGDKGGDNRFYERMIAKCETIWRDYLTEQRAGLHDKED